MRVRVGVRVEGLLRAAKAHPAQPLGPQEQALTLTLTLTEAHPAQPLGAQEHAQLLRLLEVRRDDAHLLRVRARARARVRVRVGVRVRVKARVRARARVRLMVPTSSCASPLASQARIRSTTSSWSTCASCRLNHEGESPSRSSEPPSRETKSMGKARSVPALPQSFSAFTLAGAR